MRLIPLCELAPPPPPFMFAARCPRPSRSTHAVKSGTASCGGSFWTVFRIRSGSEWLRHVSSRRESDECSAWISVRVNELAGTESGAALFGFPDLPFGCRGKPSSSSSLSDEPSRWATWSPPETAVSRWPRLSSARSTSSAPSVSPTTRLSAEGS